MRKVFWDAMLLIYLLEENSTFFSAVEETLYRSKLRGDQLFTSSLAIAELLAGVRKRESPEQFLRVESAIREMRFRTLPFDDRCIPLFSLLRATRNVSAPDAIHLSCAGAEGMDLFLTNNRKLLLLHVPGVKFIADLRANIW